MADPFPFIGHGVGFARKRMELYLGFADEVTVDDRGHIEAGCPAPLSCFFEWTVRGLAFGSDDTLHARVRRAYAGRPIAGRPGTEQWRAMAEDLESWVRETHGRWPIAYVIWPLDQEVGHDTDGWHDRSLAQIPSTILPDLLQQDSDHARWFVENVARLWRATTRARPAAEQAAALDALSPDVRRALDDFDLLWVPEEPAPVDTRREIEPRELLEVWRDTPRTPGTLEASLREIQARRFPDTKPADLRYTLVSAVREMNVPGDGLELCDLVLAEGASPEWSALRAQFLAALGRLEEAKLALPAVLAGHVRDERWYSSNEAMIAFHDYHAATGETELAEVILHGGSPLGSFLRLEARSLGRSVRDRAPPRAATRFAELLDRWLDPAWAPDTWSEEERWRCRRALEKLPKRPLAKKRASLE